MISFGMKAPRRKDELLIIRQNVTNKPYSQVTSNKMNPRDAVVCYAGRLSIEFPPFTHAALIIDGWSFSHKYSYNININSVHLNLLKKCLQPKLACLTMMPMTVWERLRIWLYKTCTGIDFQNELIRCINQSLIRYFRSCFGNVEMIGTTISQNVWHVWKVALQRLENHKSFIIRHSEIE